MCACPMIVCVCVYAPRAADVDGHKDPFEVIMVLPGGPGPLPLLLIPHGGPHSAFSTAFIAKHAFFASQGIAVCAVNYRGSLGFGTQPLTALLGVWLCVAVCVERGNKDHCLSGSGWVLLYLFSC